MKKSNFVWFLFATSITCCGQSVVQHQDGMITETVAGQNLPVIDDKGMTIFSRFNPPPGYDRADCDEQSFGYYLRHLPLKPADSPVLYFDGQPKQNLVYDAVIEIDVGNKDLQQCADAILRLRAEYFYSKKQFSEIVFPFTNGFRAEYAEWMKGNRIQVNGNNAAWKKTAAPSESYKDFRKFMEMVFSYAGTLSLSLSMKQKNIKDLSIGDVFIQAGSPGHAVLVVDVAENQSGEKIFLLAQSYMPAQDIHVLKNFGNDSISPWYRVNQALPLSTPEWSFETDQLKTF